LAAVRVARVAAAEEHVTAARLAATLTASAVLKHVVVDTCQVSPAISAGMHGNNPDETIHGYV